MTNEAKTMKKAVLLLMIVFLFILSACHKNLNAGIVVDKQFSPAHKLYSPMIMVANKKTHIIPRWISYPDRWSIWVQDGENRDCWNVSKEYYDSVQIGDYVDRNVQ